MLLAFQFFLVLMLLQIVLQLGIHLVSPTETHLRLTYSAGDSNCAEFARRLHANSIHDVSFTVIPWGEAEISRLCWLDLTGVVSADDVGAENRQLLQGTQDFAARQGFFNHELTINRALGGWQKEIVAAVTLLLSLFWLWRFRLPRERSRTVTARSINANP